LARTGTPARAAAQLKVDHTTVRRRINLLEESLRARLFEPRDRGFELTEVGREMLQTVERVESLIVGVIDEIAEHNTKVSGSVRVGAHDGLATMFLTPHLARLIELHPDLSVEVVSMSRLFNLSNRDADIAIIMSPPVAGRQTIRKLVDCRLHLYATEGYLSQRPEIKTADDLADHRFVGYLDESEFSKGLNFNRSDASDSSLRFSSNSLLPQYYAALSGAGICLLPPYVARASPELLPILPDEIFVDREIWITIHSDLKHVTRFREIFKFILNVVRENEDMFHSHPSSNR